MITPSKEKQKIDNAQVLGRAIAEFQHEVNSLILCHENGWASVKLHIGDGKITRQEIDRRRFPK